MLVLSSAFVMFRFKNVREIHQAVQNLVDPNQWFADTVDARQASEYFTHARIN